MKKVFLGCLAVCLSIVLVACSNEADKKVTEQSKTIESLEKKIKTMESENSTLVKLKKGESIDLSGELVVGTDLPAGIYDLKSTSGGGNVSIYSKDNNLILNELMGESSESSATNGYIADYKANTLHDNDKISASGVTIKFTKVR